MPPRGATSGGLSRLACAAAVHNAMLDRDPPLVAALYEPFHFHMAGGNVPGLPATFISPIFSLYKGRFSVRYVRHTLLETPHRDRGRAVPPGARRVRPHRAHRRPAQRGHGASRR